MYRQNQRKPLSANVGKEESNGFFLDPSVYSHKLFQLKQGLCSLSYIDKVEYRVPLLRTLHHKHWEFGESVTKYIRAVSGNFGIWIGLQNEDL